MNEEQKNGAASIGAMEILRLGLAVDSIGDSAEPITISIFVLTMFIFPFIAYSWKPAYFVLR